MTVSRRDFLTTAAFGSLSLGLQSERAGAQGAPASPTKNPSKTSTILCSHNGLKYLDDAYTFLRNGGDTLDAALRVVKGAEDDPNDTSVGLGGLPNEEGVVELDACCMDGPTRRAGAVGAVRHIKNVCLVARAVMEHTGHVMLVGEGAEHFAVAQGFTREDLLTDHSRKTWLLWKETHSDWWGPGPADPNWKKRWQPGVPQSRDWEQQIKRIEKLAADLGIEPEWRMDAIRELLFPPTGTIHCSALNDRSEISGCTSTSGLAWKIPGRVGDSAVIGAGCYTDQDVGSAGATGNGEENIKVAGAYTIVENMHKGMSPQEAGMDALKRIARNYDNDMERLAYVDMMYYILRKDGAHAGVSLWEGSASHPGRPHSLAVHDGTKRAEKTTSLFSGLSQPWPPKVRAR